LPKIGGNVKAKSVVITDTYGVYKDFEKQFLAQNRLMNM
jgi:hypothetical protein